MKKRNLATWILAIFILNLLGFISAAPIDEELHLNIQVINSSGDVEAGTFDFEFNISTTANCANVVYTNFTNLTTDSRGIISYYLEDVNMSIAQQYWLCYYRDDVLINASKIARTPYSFSARNVSAEGIVNDSNIDLTGKNVTASSGLFDWLGSLLDRIRTLFVQDIDFSGNINGSGWINTTSNMSASYYFGDGSKLTGISTYNATYEAINTTANIQNLVNNSINSSNYLDDYDSAYFMPLNKSVTGDFDFNGGWQNGGFSIVGGNIFAQTGYFYNISAIEVTNLNINGSLIPVVGFDDTFDIGSASLRWKDIHISGKVYSGDWSNVSGSQINNDLNWVNSTSAEGSFNSSGWNRTAGKIFLGHPGDSVGIGTASPTHKLNVVGDANITSHLVVGENLNVSGTFYLRGINISTWELNVSKNYTKITFDIYNSTWDESGWVSATFTPLARILTAGSGLTGGGDLSADRTFTVGQGLGITVNADDVAVAFGTSFLGWGNLTDYPTACASSETITVIGDMITCSAISIMESQVSNADWWDEDADILADEISEGKIAFSTACPSGSYYYLNGNDLACRADPLDTILEWQGLCTDCVEVNDIAASAVDLTSQALSTAYAGIGILGGGASALGFDCSEVEGTGINCVGEAITLDATGDWTGTLDTLNAASFLRSDADDTVTNLAVETSFYSGAAVGTGTAEQATLEVYQGTAGADAFMQFHVGGDYAAYFGLDGGVNDFVVGGWSMGANTYRVWHDNNGISLWQAACTGCVAETDIAQNTLDDSELATGGVGSDSLADTVAFTEVNANYFDVVAGNDYGLRFWNSASYMISMGNDQDNDGTVTDYSMHHNMGTTAGRGFTFGSSNTAVSASINALTGDIHTDGEVQSDGAGDNWFLGKVGIGTDSPNQKLHVVGNVNITGNLTVGGQVSITGASRVRVTKDDAQVIATATAVIVEYDDEDFDNLGEYDNVTNHRFTAIEAGYYDVKASIAYYIYAWASGDIAYIYIFKNGATYSTQRFTTQVSMNLYVNLNIADIIYLTAGEFIEIRVYHDRGANTNLWANSDYNYFAVHRLS